MTRQHGRQRPQQLATRATMAEGALRLGLRVGIITVALAAVAVVLPARATAGELERPRELGALCALSAPNPEAPATVSAAGMVVTPSEDRPLTPATRSMARRAYMAKRSAALLETWWLTVGPQSAHIIDEDALLGELVLAGSSPFELFGGDSGLALNAPSLRLSCGLDGLDAAVVAHRAGLVRLEVEVQLAAAEKPTQHFCSRESGSGSESGDRLIIHGDLLRARLVHLGTGDVLCAMETARAKEREVRLAAEDTESSLHAEVEVTRIDLLESDTAAQSDDSRQASPPSALSDRSVLLLRHEVEAALMPCYQGAVCRTGHRQGALTFRARIDGGELREPSVTVDALDSEHITSCALGQLERITAPVQIASARVGLVVIFRLGRSVRDDPSAIAHMLGATARSGLAGLRGLARH